MACHTPHRFHSHPAHPPVVHCHNKPPILHVTISVASGKPLLGNHRAHAACVKGWQQSTHWLTGEYMIMPDHIHLFCAPGIVQYPPIRRWAGFWKRKVGNLEPALKRIFQEDCWDTQMRSPEHYDEKLAYVRQNPVRRKLATDWQDWPYRGKVFDVGWI